MPNGITGTRASAQRRTMSATSSVDCAKTTASAGSFGSQLVVFACWRRISAPCDMRSPNWAFSRSRTPGSPSSPRPPSLRSAETTIVHASTGVVRHPPHAVHRSKTHLPRQRLPRRGVAYRTRHADADDADRLTEGSGAAGLPTGRGLRASGRPCRRGPADHWPQPPPPPSPAGRRRRPAGAVRPKRPW